MTDFANRPGRRFAGLGVRTPVGGLGFDDDDATAPSAPVSPNARGFFGRLWAFLIDPPASAESRSSRRGWDAEPRIFDLDPSDRDFDSRDRLDD